MRFQCPFCRSIVAVENDDCGLEVQCGSCGEVVMVPPSRVATGAVISDFIILEELGRGGMGVVYLAYQISLDRQAALKVLADHYANNAEFVVGFIKEARAAAKLNHPHIVQAYAVGEDEGIFYFAMENVDGETMKNVLKRRKIIPVDEAVSIIQQIAEALDYAWKEQRLIHRDIKPDNIMITKNGRAKLADLGLARVASDLEDEDDEEVMGTPQYISPEHLTGAPMDVRSDIYSLGATFFHLITGRFPFEGRTATEIAKKHLEETLRSPAEVNPDIPDSVCKIIKKMMAKNVKDRYQDAEELVDDLRMVRQGKAPVGAAASDSNKKKTQSVKKKTGKVFSMSKTTGKVTKVTLETDTSTTASRRLSSDTGSGTKTGTGSKFKSGTGTRTKSSFTGTGSSTLSGSYSMDEFDEEGSRKKKMAIGIACFVIVLIIAGVVGFLVMSGKTDKPDSSGSTVAKPSKKLQKIKKPTVTAALKTMREILAFHTSNPGKKKDILEKCDDFFIGFSKPTNNLEQKAYDSLYAIYLPLDEDRIELKRNEMRREQQKQVKDKEYAFKEEQRLKKEKEDRERSAKMLEDRMKKIAEEKAQREKERLEAYKKSIVSQKNSMRRLFIDRVLNQDYEDAEKVFKEATEAPFNVTNDSYEQYAKDFAEWGDEMVSIVQAARKVYEAVYNGGSSLAGIQLSAKNPKGKERMGKIVSIDEGKVTMKPFLDEPAFQIPLATLPWNTQLKIVKKAANEISDENAAFMYFLANADFRNAKKLAPDDWKQEVKKIASQYIFYKLRDGSPTVKADLKKKYRKLREYKDVVKLLASGDDVDPNTIGD